MRKSSQVSLFILALISLSLSNAALGAENPSVIAGFGLGGHKYEGPDDIKESGEWPWDDYLTQYYLEWYPFDHLGIGLHNLSMGSTELKILSYTTG